MPDPEEEMMTDTAAPSPTEPPAAPRFGPYDTPEKAAAALEKDDVDRFRFDG